MPKALNVLTKVAASVAGGALRSAPQVRIAVLVANDADESLVRSVRDALAPSTADAMLYVAAFGDGTPAPVINAKADVAIVLVGGDVALACDYARDYAAADVKAVAVAPSLGLPADLALRARLAQGGLTPQAILITPTAKAGEGVLRWMVGNLPAHVDVLGRAFAGAARARRDVAIRRAVTDNVLMGMGKGSHMAPMMANQAIMATRIAGSQGVGLDATRLADVGALALGSVALRGLARKAVAFLPLPASLVRMGVAGLGTWAVGAAMDAYYEGVAQGRDPLGDAVRDASAQVGRALTARRES